MRCLIAMFFLPIIFAAEKIAIKDLSTNVLKGAKNGAAYVTIYNGNACPVILFKVEIEPEISDRIELHDHIERDNKGIKYMEMIEIPSMEIAPGQTLFLAPGSKHLMLMNIKETYCQAKKLTFKFFFRNANHEFQIESSIENSIDKRCRKEIKNPA